MKTKKLALMALLTAIALTIFMVEAQIPPLVPLPGVKIGLSNIVTVFAVFALGPGEAASILFCRIFLGSIFAGNFSSILYSAAGGFCAIAVTILLRRVLSLNQLWVAGALSAIAHSVGQMAMAITITATPSIAVYLPILIAISIVTGTFTGLCAQILVNRGKKTMENYLQVNFSPAQVNQISNLGLAHVGDGVYELMCRTYLCKKGDQTVKTLHYDTVALVKATTQAKFADILKPYLTEDEAAYFRRGKNAHTHAAPGAATKQEYSKATGLETLFGALYLLGRTDRLNELFSLIMNEDE